MKLFAIAFVGNSSLTSEYTCACFHRLSLALEQAKWRYRSTSWSDVFRCGNGFIVHVRRTLRAEHNAVHHGVSCISLQFSLLMSTVLI